MSINFNGKTFPVLSVYIDDFGYRNIAPESLENQLLQGGRYVSKEAQIVDETIFFFAPDVLFMKGSRETQEKIKNDVRKFVELNVA